MNLLKKKEFTKKISSLFLHRRRHFCLHERFGVFPVYTTGYVNNNNNNKEGEKKKKAPLLTRLNFYVELHDKLNMRQVSRTEIPNTI